MSSKLTTTDLHRLTTEEYRNSPKLPICIVLDNVRSLHNVGSVFRTSDAFLIQKIILTGITGKPPHREITKTALGATESVQWEYQEDTIQALDKLKQEGWAIAVLEQTNNSVPLQSYQAQKGLPIAFVFGNEVLGVQDEAVAMADMCIEIPQFGTKHSFNISVTVGIVLWHYFLNTQL